MPPRPFPQKILLVSLRVIQRATVHGRHFVTVETATVGQHAINPWRLVLPTHVWTIAHSIPVIGFIYQAVHSSPITIGLTLLVVLVAEISLLIMVYRSLKAITQPPHQ